MNQQDATTSISYKILDQENEIRAWSRYGTIIVHGTELHMISIPSLAAVYGIMQTYKLDCTL